MKLILKLVLAGFLVVTASAPLIAYTCYTESADHIDAIEYDDCDLHIPPDCGFEQCEWEEWTYQECDGNEVTDILSCRRIPEIRHTRR